MPEHVHVHAPHELSESSEAMTGRERAFEIAAAVMLSLATVGIAWSGYQAARWSGVQAEQYTRGEHRAQSGEPRRGGADRRSGCKTSSTSIGGSRSRPTATRSWRTCTSGASVTSSGLRSTRGSPQDPLNNPTAEASPLRMPQYVLAERGGERSPRRRIGDERFAEGKEATENADDYVFITVFFASVLFFAGISLRFAWPTSARRARDRCRASSSTASSS